MQFHVDAPVFFLCRTVYPLFFHHKTLHTIIRPSKIRSQRNAAASERSGADGAQRASRSSARTSSGTSSSGARRQAVRLCHGARHRIPGLPMIARLLRVIIAGTARRVSCRTWRAPSCSRVAGGPSRAHSHVLPLQLHPTIPVVNVWLQR